MEGTLSTKVLTQRLIVNANRETTSAGECFFLSTVLRNSSKSTVPVTRLITKKEENTPLVGWAFAN